MAEVWVHAQWTVVGTLMSDGHILLHESFTLQSEEGKPREHTHAFHEVHGTCDPEELAVVTHDAIAAHL